MTPIHHDQRCECAHPRPSGMYYLGREACRSCGCFLVRSKTEREELRQAELRAIVKERGIWPEGTAPVLTAQDVYRIVGNMLGLDPTLTNEQMRDKSSTYGRYPHSDFAFFAQCTRVRKDLGIPAQLGRRPIHERAS